MTSFCPLYFPGPYGLNSTLVSSFVFTPKSVLCFLQCPAHSRQSISICWTELSLKTSPEAHLRRWRLWPIWPSSCQSVPLGSSPQICSQWLRTCLTLDFCLGPARKTCPRVPPARLRHCGNQWLARERQSSCPVPQQTSVFRWWVTSHLGQPDRRVPIAQAPLLQPLSRPQGPITGPLTLSPPKIHTC